MDKILKILLGTFLVLEVLAIVTHLGELIDYVGNVFIAIMPVFIIIVAIIWMVRSIFR